jgi:hypothetical protein
MRRAAAEGTILMKIEEYFDNIIKECQAIFEKKLLDYGPTWLVFRWLSLTDQIWIKLKRLRTLEGTAEPLVEDTPLSEYRGVINYCLIGLMKAEGALPADDAVLDDPSLLPGLDPTAILARYTAAAAAARVLMLRKNHDYGEAWRSMAVSSVTDQMLIKVLRVKQLLTNRRTVPDSDNITAQLSDVLNYCVFSIWLKEKGTHPA